VILSKRERYVGYGAAAAIGLLALNYFALDPLLKQKESLDRQAQSIQNELDVNTALLGNNALMARRWNEMQQEGLQADQGVAETNTETALNDWALQSRLDLSLLKPDRPIALPKHRQYRQITFRVTANGSMDSIRKFLTCVQSARMPIRVTDLRINARKEGGGADDLQLTLSVSTLYLAPEPVKPGKAEGATGSSVASAFGKE
jgi:hypothetical protein